MPDPTARNEEGGFTLWRRGLRVHVCVLRPTRRQGPRGWRVLFQGVAHASSHGPAVPELAPGSSPAAAAGGSGPLILIERLTKPQQALSIRFNLSSNVSGAWRCTRRSRGDERKRNVPSLHEGRPAALLLRRRRLRVRRRVALLGVAGRRVALRRRWVAGRRVPLRRVAVLPWVAWRNQDPHATDFSLTNHNNKRKQRETEKGKAGERSRGEREGGQRRGRSRGTLLRRDADGGLLAVVAHPVLLLLPCDRRRSGRQATAVLGLVWLGLWRFVRASHRPGRSCSFIDWELRVVAALFFFGLLLHFRGRVRNVADPVVGRRVISSPARADPT